MTQILKPHHTERCEIIANHLTNIGISVGHANLIALNYTMIDAYLAIGDCLITYTKADGSTRNAVASHLMNYYQFSGKVGGEPNYMIYRYWDVSKNSVRTIRMDRFMSISILHETPLDANFHMVIE